MSSDVVDRVPVRELASGIDSFYVSGRGQLSAKTWMGLLDLKARAVETNTPATVVFGPAVLRVAAGGLPHYPVRLDHEYCAVGVTASEQIPTLLFQPRSEYLQAVGATEATRWFRRTFEPVVRDLVLGISRLDLFVDVQGFEPRPDDRLRFVTRARTCATYEDTAELTGFVVGRRKSGITFRLYDKTLDMARKHVGFWPEVSGDRYDDAAAVWRAEIELHRSVLREFRVDTPEEAISSAGAIFRTLTEDWISLRVPSADRTRSRWAEDPAWSAIRAARIGHDAIPLERLKSANEGASLEWWRSRLVGAIAACGALIHATSAPEALAAVPSFVDQYERDGHHSLASRMAEKRLELAP